MASALIGREQDRAALDDLVQSVREGLSAALVLRGEPGIGKTRLVTHAIASAAGVRCREVLGVEAEARLGFAALHGLLAGFPDLAAGLPAPQREALQSTFGLAAGPPPDRFLVGLATLTLLAEVAAERPLLCVVDDAQWLDRESLEVLGFVGRRLGVEGVGLVLCVRDEPEVPAALTGLPTRRLTGLAPAAARALLSSQVEGTIEDQVAGRIVTETGGNPLALIELAAELTQEQLSGRALLPVALPVGPRLEALFLRRVRALPADTQSLLLVAAAAPRDDPALWAAGALLGVGPEAADPAVAEGVLSLHPQVAFRHPLIRSAVYGAAPEADRQRAHRALAAALSGERDRDRRAWHLAAAAVGPDEEVAAELERCAERARSRGGYSAQAAFLLRAAELTPDAGSKAVRRLASASAHLLSGDPVKAQALLDLAAPRLLGPLAHVQEQRLRAKIEAVFSRIAAVPSILMDAVTTIEPHDRALAREMLFDALGAAMIAHEHTAGTTLEEVARAARAAPREQAGKATVPDLLLDGFAARIAVGYAPAVPLLREAVTAICTDDQLVEVGMPLAMFAALAGDDLWDDHGRRKMLERLDRDNREHGAITGLGITLLGLAHCELLAGRLHDAEAVLVEYNELTRAGGVSPQGELQRVELLAWQGREVEARAVADIAIHHVGERLGIMAAAHVAFLALSALELSLGRYREALTWSRRLYDADPPAYGNRALADMVEAGVRAGDRAAAGVALTRLAERASASGTAWALGNLARGRALMADDDHAERFYQQSVTYLGTTTVATELARSQLLYGEWLRYRNRHGDAREQLHNAHAAFAAMGAAGFAERARTELLAAGERVRRTGAKADFVLTQQEAQIASLASEGATNAEIATRLFVTPATINYHLKKIFRKLGLTSRRQLTQALHDRAESSGAS